MAVAKKTPNAVIDTTFKETLRIQLAAAAMTGLIAKGSTFDHETMCKLSLQYADTMMEIMKK
jgi:hypothetical protein